MAKVTTNKLKSRSVTIGEDVPFADLLTRAAAELLHWQEEVERLSAEMASLQRGNVYLDNDGKPVVPGWWERKESGHHKAWYLVWPSEYARQSGRKRREYVRSGDLEATRATVGRTLEYANLEARQDKLNRQLEAAGRELARLADKYGW